MNTIIWSDVLTIIVPVCTIVLGIQTYIYKLIGDEAKSRHKLVVDIDARLNVCRENDHKIRNELMVFKENIARDTVTHATLEKFENRLISSIEKLGDRLDRALVHSTMTVIK